MSILLPNIPNAPIEDILEIRQKAKNELIELQNYIDGIANEIDIEKFTISSEDEINYWLHKKINPSIAQLERRFKDIRIKTLQEFLKKMFNPLKYAPLITSFIADAPLWMSLTASGLFISIDTLLTWLKCQNDIKDHSLYFTVKINSLISNY